MALSRSVVGGGETVYRDWWEFICLLDSVGLQVKAGLEHKISNSPQILSTQS
jgi:hypothetical protein